MQITFSIEYQAEWGQRLCISGSIPELGAWQEDEALELTPTSHNHWEGRCLIDGRRRDFTYYYLIKDEAGRVLRREWKRMHRLSIGESLRAIYMDDHWIDRPANAPFYSSSFYDALFRHEAKTEQSNPKNTSSGKRIILEVYAPTVPPSKTLYVLGNVPELGAWQSENAPSLSYAGKGLWSLELFISQDTLGETHSIDFKFFIADAHREGIRWEATDNRHITLPPGRDYELYCIAGMIFEEGEYRPRFAGMVAPLFSLRSEVDFGVGDFGALRKAIDWAVQSGLHVLQLLPINDTTFYRDWRDSYPYNAISVNALHPIYADLSQLPPLRSAKRQRDFEARAALLRQTPTLAYPEVIALKEEYLWVHYSEQGVRAMRPKAFQLFVQHNQDWLYPYAYYCFLRDKHEGVLPSSWGEDTQYNSERFAKTMELEEGRKRMLYYIYTQYLLSNQLLEVRQYAEEREILLKGDLPIGVAPHSVEAWVNPELFHLDRSAGAPPDAFAVDGQNWGFPTYNWEAMRKDGLLWWRGRFAYMAEYFKAFRIDHILGFFRIWEVPRSQRSGLLGHFSPALPYSLERWQELLGGTLHVEQLIYPSLTEERAQRLFGKYLPKLIASGLLIPIEETSHLRLYTRYQAELEALAVRAVPGGEAVRTQLVELAKGIALIEDMTTPGYYHPRIAFETTEVFASWSAEAQRLWRAVSEDYFYHRHNELWRETARERLLPLLGSTDMLVCAEDLGMIPATVPEVLEELQILSLELERMPKAETPSGLASLSTLPYHAVCTTSTHDMPPLKAWWLSLGQKAQAEYLREYHPYLRLGAEHPLAEVCSAIVSAHVASPAMLVLLPLQDWTSIDPKLSSLQAPENEQINHPEDPNQKWAWRMPLTLESLTTNHNDLSLRIKTMLLSVNRG